MVDVAEVREAGGDAPAVLPLAVRLLRLQIPPDRVGKPAGPVAREPERVHRGRLGGAVSRRPGALARALGEPLRLGQLVPEKGAVGEARLGVGGERLKAVLFGERQAFAVLGFAASDAR